MKSPLAPGPQRSRWAPLPTLSFLIGVVFCAVALTASFSPTLVANLVRDTLFARVLGITSLMAGAILARVSVRAAAGLRRVVGVAVASPFLALGILFIVSPTSATWLHDTGRTIFVPWVFGIPAVFALMLSRWRVR